MHEHGCAWSAVDEGLCDLVLVVALLVGDIERLLPDVTYPQCLLGVGVWVWAELTCERVHVVVLRHGHGHDGCKHGA